VRTFLGDNTTTLVDNIFSQAVEGSTIFKDRAVLAPEYVPSNLPFRDEQIKSIAQALSHILRGSPSSNLLLYGKTGTGKTATARFVLDRLRRTAEKRNLATRVAYSNMRLAGTPYRVLLDLAHSIGVTLPFTGLSFGEAFQRILEAVQQSCISVVFVMDEIDYLVKNAGDRLLYDLTRSRTHLQSGFINIVGISNDLKFKEFLDARVLSSLSEEEVVFPPYDAAQLSSILSQRASLAFKPDAVPTSTINLCAALAASEHGDGRRAIDLLRVSGEVAERSNSPKVEEAHVRIALQKIEQDRTIQTITSLPIQAKVLLIAALKDASSTGDLYAKYSHSCRQLNLDTLTHRRVSTLLNELDLLGLVSASITNRGRYGRTKKIRPLLPADTIISILKDDPSVASLI